MKSLQVKGKGEEKLEQLYQKLQHDWDAYKQSNPATSRKKKFADSHTTIKVFQPLDNSPRDIMAKLQLQALNVMRARDVAAQEIIHERRAAIESGRLKGRRLFEYPMQNEGQVADIYNGWSKMGEEDSEERSLSSFYNSDEEHEEERESNECKGMPNGSKSSLSSSPCLSDAFKDKHEELKGEEDTVATLAAAETKVATNGRAASYNGASYLVFLGGLAIVLLIFAICMSSDRGFGRFEVIAVPT